MELIVQPDAHDVDVGSAEIRIEGRKDGDTWGVCRGGGRNCVPLKADIRQCNCDVRFVRQFLPSSGGLGLHAVTLSAEYRYTLVSRA